MKYNIVFVHGIAQEGKDPDVLKNEWIDFLNRGLASNDPPLPPVDPATVRFPYFGDTLKQLADGVQLSEVSDIALRGGLEASDDAMQFLFDIFEEIRKSQGMSDESISDATGGGVSQLGPENWRWIRAILQRLDENPRLSAATIALTFYCVFQYVTNGTVRARIDRGVAEAFSSNRPTVVVGHSLGSVIAYTLLLREGTQCGWNVPLFITLGSPLAINAIRERAPGIANVTNNCIPECVDSWLNGLDPVDVVALRPLTSEYFRLSPASGSIENIEMQNWTRNHHSIGGYLTDPRVAKRIHDVCVQQPKLL